MKANPSGRSPALSLLGWPLLPLLAAVGCTGGQKGDPENRGDFKVVSISTGTGAVYPYRIRKTDIFRNPTNVVLNIEDKDTLTANVTGNNGVLPVATLNTVPELPNGLPGNHFLHFAFSHKLDVKSILSDQLANQGNAGLTGNLSLLAYDAATETSLPVSGRGFVNGITYYNVSGRLVPVQAVVADGLGVRVVDEILDPATLKPLNPRQFLTGRTVGFPNYSGAADLVSKKSFTFVADTDSDLGSIEMFPSDRLIRIRVSSAVRDNEGDILALEVGTATTVGSDGERPQVLGYLTTPQISPGNNQSNIDTQASILVRFNKPVQPGLVGSFFSPQQLVPPSGGVTISVTAAAQTFGLSYHADPLNYANMMDYVITPAYNLPGQAAVDVAVPITTIRAINNNLLIGQQVATRFTTGIGQGIINAPVAPEAIYVGIGGAEPGVSVIDMNGLGQGTGDITNTRFNLNPNIGRAGVTPPMSPGTTNLDAGSSGVLTLVKDTNLETRLLKDPLVGEITDIHIGAPLDLVFNNENINANATRANQINEGFGAAMSGNVIAQPPVPNPPKLLFPPPNPARAIFGEEPTTKSSFGPPGALVTGGPPANCLAAGLNLLVQGNPFANSASQIGLFGSRFMGVFVGPQPPPGSPPPPTPFCPFTSRQQIGHFLYVLDRDNRRVLVVNSNRFTVLDSIRLSDPVSMAMSPNMNRLAVSNFSSASISFIDIDPTSSTFHQIVSETRLNIPGPTALSWQPDGEDLLVLSTNSNALTIVSALDYRVRKEVTGFLNRPIEVIVTERYQRHGNQSGLYYAYILNSNGTVAIYESGPDGVNGIGFNDVVSLVTNESFPRARSMCYDTYAGQGGVLIGHVDESGLGQISRLWLTASPLGQLPLQQNTGGFVRPPNYRQKEWFVTQRFGGLQPNVPRGEFLSGNTVIDICTDDMFNNGGLLGQGTPFNAAFVATPYNHSGKHTVKGTANGVATATVPRLLFLALSDVGKIDVFEIQSGTRITTIDVPGVRVVSSYWRQ